MANIIDILINMTKQGSGAEDAGSALDDVGTSAASTGTALLGSVIGFTSVTGAALALVAGLKAASAAAADEQTAETRMAGTIDSTGRSSQISAVYIEQLATAEEGLFTKTDIENAANKLMTYMDIPTAQIPGDLILLQNMAAEMGGTVTDAANTLGLALETGRVRGLGFSKEITTEIALLASHGQIAQMDAIILDSLSQRYAGQASIALNTFAGAEAQAGTAGENLKIVVGNDINPTIQEFLTLVTQSEQGWANFLTGLGQTRQYNEEVNNLSKSLYDAAVSAGGLSVQGLDPSMYRAQAEAIIANQTAMDASVKTTNDAADAQQKLADATAAAAAAAAQEVAGETFLDNATKSLSSSDAQIKTIEDNITAARKAGYSESGSKIQGYETQVEDLKTKENTAMLQMAANWVYTQDVMTGKMDMSTFLGLEESMGLITTGEGDAALGWLKYAQTLAANPATQNVYIDTYYTTHGSAAQGTGGGLPPPPPSTLPVVSKIGSGLMQASGGDYIVDSPTHFIAGEAGPERATFTPLGGGGGGGAGAGSIVINVSGAGNPDQVAERVAQILLTRLGAQGIKTRIT